MHDPNRLTPGQIAVWAAFAAVLVLATLLLVFASAGGAAR